MPVFGTVDKMISEISYLNSLVKSYSVWGTNSRVSGTFHLEKFEVVLATCDRLLAFFLAEPDLGDSSTTRGRAQSKDKKSFGNPLRRGSKNGGNGLDDSRSSRRTESVDRPPSSSTSSDGAAAVAASSSTGSGEHGRVSGILNNKPALSAPSRDHEIELMPSQRAPQNCTDSPEETDDDEGGGGSGRREDKAAVALITQRLGVILRGESMVEEAAASRSAQQPASVHQDVARSLNLQVHTHDDDFKAHMS